MDIKCSKCKTKNPKDADICKNCGADLKKQKRGGCIIMSVIGVIIIVILISIFSGDEDQNIVEKEAKTKQDALVMSQLFVEDRLKSPSSAEFGYEYEDNVFKKNDSTFVVRSYVDSQNSFGAMLRNQYVCELYFDSDGDAHLIDLTMTEN